MDGARIARGDRGGAPGRWEIVLTPTKPVPHAWLHVVGRQVLCLACGGGQQAPILAAAVPDVVPVWREAFRVLRPGCCLGALKTG